MKLSFVVPIYGVEQYLHNCVDSLLYQNYDDYEIILVDDGGTDGCPQICDEYAEMSDKVRVIHRANGGLSAARNTGIEAAKGDYICFVDSDDYWEPNVLDGLMTQIERDGLDVLRFRWQNVRSVKESTCWEKNEYEVFQPYYEENFADFSNSVLNGEDFLNKRMGIQCYVVQFIIKRDLIVSNCCLFTEGILFEDTDWTPRMLVLAKRVASTETIVYNYLWRENGITLSVNPNKLRKEVEDKIALIERLRAWGTSDWYYTMISALTVSVVNILGGKLYDVRKQYLKLLFENQIFPLTKKGLNKRTRRKVGIINFSPYLAVWMLHLRNLE